VSGNFIRPDLSEVNRGFWEAADEGALVLQRCDACAELRYPAAQRCPVCLSANWSWQQVSGRGEVLSYIVIHQKYNDAWADRVPYNVSLIQLEEGPRMVSNVVPLSGAPVWVGMPVRVVFERDDSVAIPRFELDDRDGKS
jgi:uncharacterized OB-fold protein